jgi:hypothetical protein
MVARVPYGCQRREAGGARWAREWDRVCMYWRSVDERCETRVKSEGKREIEREKEIDESERKAERGLGGRKTQTRMDSEETGLGLEMNWRKGIRTETGAVDWAGLDKGDE